ncbi:MAG TPA: cytidine deaminase [Hellea balneolensis]|uniref:Cytidine deaminase n=1 Tax=Hellea balneolensis TaxID=287478 RepID=A0A7V5NWW6_9PROT|nr:cytidine deaminase [Hellea balneolensis]
MAAKPEARLVFAAQTVRENAYAPYSGFKVGAALLADDGQVYAGCNVENAAYPEGQCAEASAISAMIAGGGCKVQQIVIVKKGHGKIAPCGGCRQKLNEFAESDLPIYVQGADGALQCYSLGELLPVAFGKKHLEEKT